MNIHNIEVKARISELKYREIRDYLVQNADTSMGTDRQSDYYFRVVNGRLKLRMGNIERSLIYYKRAEKKGMKSSRVNLYKIDGDPGSLLTLLRESLTVWKEIHKQREIFFIENIKFHLDAVQDLGLFFEIEAISTEGKIDRVILQKQCSQYMQLFGIIPEMCIDQSYSDMI